MTKNYQEIIKGTQQWLADIVIGLNFCPFAKKEFVNNTIDYVVVDNVSLEEARHVVFSVCKQLELNSSIETSLIVFLTSFDDFNDYLSLLDEGNEVIDIMGYSGVFQLASFHPDYCFEGVLPNDPENYTNRSPWPMLHVIREASMTRVLEQYPNPELIPENNIRCAINKGAHYFQQTLMSIWQKAQP